MFGLGNLLAVPRTLGPGFVRRTSQMHKPIMGAAEGGVGAGHLVNARVGTWGGMLCSRRAILPDMGTGREEHV